MASMKPKKSSLPPPKPRPSVTVGQPRNINSRILIGAIVAAVVALALGIALLVGGDDTDGDRPPIDEVAKPVTVDGDPLAPLTQSILEGQEPDTAIGQVAPVVTGVDYEDNPVTIDAAENGPTMVVLLAHWCPHCNAEIPRLNEWRDSGDVPEGLNVVGVSTGLDPTADNYPPDEWLTDKDWQWPVLADSADGTAFRAFGGQFYPTVVIIGSDGAVLSRFSGEPSAEEIDELVTTALDADPGPGQR